MHYSAASQGRTGSDGPLPQGHQGQQGQGGGGGTWTGMSGTGASSQPEAQQASGSQGPAAEQGGVAAGRQGATPVATQPLGSGLFWLTSKAAHAAASSTPSAGVPATAAAQHISILGATSPGPATQQQQQQQQVSGGTA